MIEVPVETTPRLIVSPAPSAVIVFGPLAALMVSPAPLAVMLPPAVLVLSSVIVSPAPLATTVNAPEPPEDRQTRLRQRHRGGAQREGTGGLSPVDRGQPGFVDCGCSEILLDAGLRGSEVGLRRDHVVERLSNGQTAVQPAIQRRLRWRMAQAPRYKKPQRYSPSQVSLD